MSVQRKKFRSLAILSVIWMFGMVCDRIWFALDRSTPAWDQADYLTGTLNYWQALQNPQWWNQDWWQSLWLLSSKIPPLTYILAAGVQNIFGTGPDEATLVMLLFSGVLLGSVYGLGKVLFGEAVGLWAAFLCQVLPALYRFRLDFLLDYPLAAVVTLSFFFLSVWRSFDTLETLKKRRVVEWLWALAFGLSFGLALLVKQTALIFLLIPIVWLGVGTLRHRRWKRFVQLVGGLCLSVLVMSPWYRTNWLIVLTSGKRATIDSAIAEGEAPLNTLQAWIYYWQQLPNQVSLPLLLVPIVALLLYWGRLGFKQRRQEDKGDKVESSLKWLAVFLVGSYLLSSLNINKDSRYALPYLPTLTVFLAYGLTRLSHLWGKRIRWCTAALAVLLMLFNLFPVGGFLGSWVTQALSPNQYYPYMAEELPHKRVIAQIIQTEPLLRSTLGVLPSTAAINQHNFNYYGALQNFQVYGRQVGTRKKFIDRDVRSLEWFLTKTSNQGSVGETQASMTQAVEQSGIFQLSKSWNLPDGSSINLYHKQTPAVEVKQISNTNILPNRLTLSQVAVPEKAPPGVPVPVTYEWSGSWEKLQNGLVLLTWKNKTSQAPVPSTQSPSWIHDRAIAMGALRSSVKKPEGTFRVIERMAMLPPADIAPGIYSLQATYLNRLSGESYSIQVPNVTLQIDPQAPATPAPELDLVTQLRVLGTKLPKGTEALSQIFDEVGRINQYDPIQDYLVQARLTMEYRLQEIPSNRDWAYTLALANVLQRRVEGAISALQKVTQLDSENPYSYAYLAFVQLYNWQPGAAQKSLEPSLVKNPNIPEIKALSGAAALMQGNLVKAWQILNNQ
ncbi:glycosyltransferase family 39 protein [Scytonema sp. NUACC26]|uniref:glycosyltransferase family 39 protein n=1 Tax=Scytonema sp. NUACC26 TaxID=3140176 RepID=UPI0034DC2F22